MSANNPRHTLDLGGVWQYIKDENGEGEKKQYYLPSADRSAWRPIQVPHNWYLTEIGDYFGAVWCATEFEAPASFADAYVTLNFKAVDYYADVWLNGAYLGRHEGMFTPFSFDVSDKLVSGKNVLVVKDDSPRDPTEYECTNDDLHADTPLSYEYKRWWAKELTLIKGHMSDAMHRPGAMTKFRQDGNSGGIWDSVALVATNKVRIEKQKIYCKVVDQDGSAIVSAEVTINNTTDAMITTRVGMSFAGKNFQSDTYEREKEVQLQPGINKIRLIKTVAEPKLWSTWDFGFPHLYQMEIFVGDCPCCAIDSVCEAFGIKTIQHCAESGHFFLNGEKVFLRGMRYISSLWISEATDELYESELKLMRDMDINSIRIGSHVEKDSFYRFCDEMGFLVWQVFPLHYCYSDSDELIERAAPMMAEMVSMIYNHASVGMYSVFKEPEIYGLPNPPNNYGRLCQIMFESACTVDPIRWVHKGDYNEKVQNIMIGCCAPGDTDLHKKEVKPIIVEFGAQSIPCLETVKTFIPEDALWPPKWDVWEYWCLFYALTFKFAKIDMGNSLEEFIDNYQEYEALVVKEQIEFLRQKKWYPVGSMYLYYWRDACACVGSGLFDYYRRPYKVYYSMKQVYTPVLLSVEWNKEPYVIGYEKIWGVGDTFVGKIWATNDRLAPIKKCEIRLRLVNEETGAVVFEKNNCIDVVANASKVTDIVVWKIPEGAKGKYVLKMELDDSKGVRLSTNDFKLTVSD